jgi:cytochrome c peroxidase
LKSGLALLLLASFPGATAAAADYRWDLPRGLPIPAVPADNPMSDAKVALGRKLFFETRLSVTGTYSCASCHDPARAFTDGRARSVGATGALTANGAMSLVNIAYNVSYGWTRPDVQSLEAQMLEPLLNEHPVEMGVKGRETDVTALLTADAAYRAGFAAAFPESGSEITLDRMIKAIAAFERTLVSGRSAFDRYVFGGEHDALSAAAKRGMELFYSARLGCAECHSGFNFSGNWRDSQGATGPASFASNGTTHMPLRVPTLRNIALTAPYMHDGRFSTLEAVVAHYERAGQPLRSFVLDAAERDALMSFLQSLTDRNFGEGDEGGGTHPVSRR